jgi:hypothetical protein
MSTLVEGEIPASYGARCGGLGFEEVANACALEKIAEARGEQPRAIIRHGRRGGGRRGRCGAGGGKGAQLRGRGATCRESRGCGHLDLFSRDRLLLLRGSIPPLLSLLLLAF